MRYSMKMVAVLILLSSLSCDSSPQGGASMPDPALAQSPIQRADQLSDKAAKAYQEGNKQEGHRLTQEALTAYQAALKAAPDDGEILLCIGAQHFNIGNASEGISCYEKAIHILERQGKKEPLTQARINLAGALFTVGKKKEAIGVCDIVLASDPKNQAVLQIKQACTAP